MSAASVSGAAATRPARQFLSVRGKGAATCHMCTAACRESMPVRAASAADLSQDLCQWPRAADFERIQPCHGPAPHKGGKFGAMERTQLHGLGKFCSVAGRLRSLVARRPERQILGAPGQVLPGGAFGMAPVASFPPAHSPWRGPFASETFEFPWLLGRRPGLARVLLFWWCRKVFGQAEGEQKRPAPAKDGQEDQTQSCRLPKPPTMRTRTA